MKKIIVLTALVFFSCFKVFSQHDSTTVESRLEAYFQATQKKDWNRVMEMINPKIFSFSPKELMIQLYTQMESDAGMEMNFTEMEILDIKKGLDWSDTTYVPVDYKMTLLIHLNPSRYQDQEVLNSMLTGFELAYSGQEIAFDREQLSFTIKVKNTLIASSKLDSNLWHFGDYKPTDPMTKLIFPTEILKKLEQGWN